MDRIRKDFTTITWVMIPVAIAINMALGFIVYSLKIPFLYLDSIGTILVGLLCGPIAGMLTGALSNFAWGLFGNAGYVPYFPVAAVIGLLAGLFGQWGWYKKWWLWIFGGGLITALSRGRPVCADQRLPSGRRHRIRHRRARCGVPRRRGQHPSGQLLPGPQSRNRWTRSSIMRWCGPSSRRCRCGSSRALPRYENVRPT